MRNWGGALARPDKIEQIGVDTFSDKSTFLAQIDMELKGTTRCTFGKRKGPTSQYPAKVKLFEPHERAVSDRQPGVEFTSSIIALDMYQAYEVGAHEDQEPVGQMLLLKLGHADEPLTAKNLQLGINLVFGAYVKDGQIKPFRLEMKSGEREVQRLERSDPTSEDGVAVDARVVENHANKLVLSQIDQGKEPDVYQAMIDEVDTFLASRRAIAQESTPKLET